MGRKRKRTRRGPSLAPSEAAKREALAMLRWCIEHQPQWPKPETTCIRVTGWPEGRPLELIEFTFERQLNHTVYQQLTYFRVTVEAKQIRRMMTRRYKGPLRFRFQPITKPLMLRSSSINLLHD